MKAGIVGASGYTGAELLRLLRAHPQVEVGVATAHSHAGLPVGGHTPSLRAAYPGLVYEDTDPAVLDGLDVVFCALPHGESQKFVPELRSRVGCIVDLAADFRLRDASLSARRFGASVSPRHPRSAPRMRPLPRTSQPRKAPTAASPRWVVPSGIDLPCHAPVETPFRALSFQIAISSR